MMGPSPAQARTSSSFIAKSERNSSAVSKPLPARISPRFRWSHSAVILSKSTLIGSFEPINSAPHPHGDVRESAQERARHQLALRIVVGVVGPILQPLGHHAARLQRLAD